jgi:predicted Zn finger-like uncharacterized protein
MYTQCPNCATLFDIDAQLLAPARGRLCCGVCGREFDALEQLIERPGAVADERRPHSPPQVQPAVDPTQIDLFKPAQARPRPRPGAAPEPIVPSFVRPPPVRPRGGGRWLAAAVVLTLTLAVQIVFAQREELAGDARWRAWLEPLCTRLGCDLPPWRDPAQLTLAAHAIGPHPSVPDALMVTATLRNDAPWPQAWPLLELTMSDLGGKPVAMRRFTVAEYLGGMPDQPALDPGQSAVAQLEIADPGKEAVAFAFDFH